MPRDQKLQFDIDGCLIVDGDGCADTVDCSGETMYLQAQECPVDEAAPLADVWMTVANATTLMGIGTSFTINPDNQICLYFDLGQTPSVTPGTVYTLGDATSYDDCADCNSITNACDCDCQTFDFTYFNYSVSGGGLVLDSGSGLYYVVTTGVGLVFQGNTDPCADIDWVTDHWEAPLGTSGLISYARCPPLTLAAWTVNPGLDPAILINVQCRQTAIACADLPDVLQLGNLIGNVQVNWGDGAGDIFDGSLHRVSSVSGCLWRAKVDGSSVRVLQQDASYALMNIEVDQPIFGLSVIYLNGNPGPGAYVMQSVTVTGTYGNTGAAYTIFDYDTTNVLLPLTLTVSP